MKEATGGDVPDSQYIMVTMDSGVSFVIGAGWSLPPGYPNFSTTWIEMVGTEGALIVDDSHRDVVLSTIQQGMRLPMSSMPGEFVEHAYAGPMKAETIHFMDAVGCDRPVLVTPEQARQVMQVYSAADMSAERNQPRRKVPVFVNLEHGHQFSDILKTYAERATFCQAVTDAAQLGGKRALIGTAKKLLKSGIETAIITLAKGGCLVAQGEQIVRVFAPHVKAVDACGAGATFSAGFIYGYLKGWSLEQSARFATAAATLKVTRAGLQMFTVEEILELASHLKVERWAFKNNRFEIIDRIMNIPRQVAEQSQRARRKIMQELRIPPKPTPHKSEHAHEE